MTVPRVSSALNAIEIKQIPPPLIIGERLNTQGSKKAKQMVLSDDFDGLVDLARTQVEQGAHCLDVCVATTERADELEFMVKLVKRVSLEVDAPLVIDSTDPKVIEASLEQIPGKPIINSINLEGDGSRFKALAPLMAKYGVPAIALCIGPKGMAKNPQEKLETVDPDRAFLFAEMRNELNLLKRDVDIIKNAVTENPERAMSLPLIRRDIVSIEKDLRDFKIISSENINRIYDQNKWFLGLVASMAIGVLGTVGTFLFKQT